MYKKNTLVHSGSELPKRVLQAWHYGAQNSLIATAEVVADRLLVVSCALEMFEIPFDSLPALRSIPAHLRSAFDISSEGSYLHWPEPDIHLDMDAFRYAADPRFRERAEVLKLAADRRFGRAIARVRKQKGLTQVDIRGLSDRQVRRIEKGAMPRMDAQGADVIGINHRNKRYFVANCFKEQPGLRDFLFSDLMADVCRATLGDDAYLFWEQYVVKGAETGMKFSWHQDSGYVGYPDHKPYLTCWCALDDMSEANGTVHLLPYSRSGIRTWVLHVREEGSNDKVGYFGSDPGITAEVPAGSIVAFSSVVFHSSGTNTTKNMRRVYLAQYSGEPIMSADGTKPWGNAEPFLRNGRSVAGAGHPVP